MYDSVEIISAGFPVKKSGCTVSLETRNYYDNNKRVCSNQIRTIFPNKGTKLKDLGIDVVEIRTPIERKHLPEKGYIYYSAIAKNGTKHTIIGKLCKDGIKNTLKMISELKERNLLLTTENYTNLLIKKS